MTDLRPDFALGENVLKNTDESNFATVNLGPDVIPGQVLKVSGGISSDGIEAVIIIDAVTDDVKYMVMEAGLSDTIARVMHKGRTKVVFGAAITAGERLEFTVDSKVIPAGGTNFVKAVAVDAGVDGDLGFIDFDGGITPT